MTSFDEALRRVAGSLDLPEPVRSRLLLELRTDLESMAAALEARGVAAEEAVRRAMTALLPGPEAVEELRGVHRPLYQRLVDRYSVAGRNRLERGLLALATVAYGLVGVVVVSGLDLPAAPGALLWPVLAGATAVGVVGAAKLFHLWVAGGDGDLRRGLGLLLGLAGATLVAGFAGAVADLYVVAGRLAEGASQLETLLPWLRRESMLLSLALLAASGGGLIWLVAAVRIARIEQIRAAALGFTETGGE